MTRTLATLTVTVAIALAASSASAVIVQTNTLNLNFNGTHATNSYTASGTDLLQTNLASMSTSLYVPFTSGSDSFGPTSKLIDGSLAGNTTATSDWPNLVFEASFQNPQYIITFDLNLTGAADGYDITQFDVFTGWTDRAYQQYDVFVSKVGSAAFTQVVAPANGGTFTVVQASGGVRSSVTENVSGVIATRVDAIRFETKTGGVNGYVYREIDVFGVATVPSPAAMPAGLAMLAMIAFRGRRVA